MRPILNKIGILPGILLLCCHFAVAQTETPKTDSHAPLQAVDKISLRPGEYGYSTELAAKGVQGTTELRVRTNFDGKPEQIEIQTSSRSAQLDQAAAALVNTLQFKAAASAQGAGNYLVPVEFLRDSVATLNKKLCAEFNTDVQYFKTTFPELDTKEMTIFPMTVGTFALSGLGLGKEKLAELLKGTSKASNGIVAACAINPGANYMKTFISLVK